MNKKFLTFFVGIVALIYILSGCGTSIDFKINFEVDGEILTTVSTSGYKPISMPDNPEKDGYTFDGWFWDKDEWERPFTANSLLNESLTSNMTVYAKWISNAESVVIPVADDNLVYNGNNQSAFTDNSYYTITNGSAVNAGNYTATVVLNDKENTKWSDNTTDDLQIDWSITKAPAIIDTSAIIVEFTYNGEAQSINGATGSGTIDYEDNSFTNAGDYTVTINVAESENYLAGSTTVEIEVIPLEINVPEISETTFVYTGNEITLNVTQSSYYTISENTKTNVGNYTATLTLANNNNTIWNSESLHEGAEAFVAWTITIADNSWLSELTCDDIIVGETLEPNANSKFGNVVFSYYSDNNGIIGDLLTEQPTVAGTYWIKAEVAATDNYQGLQSTTQFLIERLYEIKFIDYDNTELDSASYRYGETVVSPENPSREADNTYTYSFAGWTPQIVVVTEDATYQATYTPNYIDYTITFKAEGNADIIDTYHYGDDVTSYNVPQKTGFDGEWNIAIPETMPAEDIVITAIYTIQTFKVYFYSENDEIDSATVDYGSTVSIPQTPTKANYEFEGWYSDRELTISFNFNNQITKVTFVYAKWTQTAITYTVSFVDYDGRMINTQTVSENEAAIPPANPERIGYNFTGWSEEFGVITSDLTIFAQYQKISYQVKFYLEIEDSNTYVSQSVEYLDNATIPSTPEKNDFVFGGWYINLEDINAFDFTTNIVEDVNLYAKWIEIENITYSVKFYTNSTMTVIIDSQIVQENTSAIAPEIPVISGYDFDGWSDDFTNITTNLDVYPTYKIKTFTVEFTDYDDTVLSTQIINYGEDATPPANPERTGYVFNSWDTSYINVVTDLTIKATYDVNVFIATFYDETTELGTVLAEYNGKFAVPSTPSKAGFSFIGWYNDINLVNEYDFNTAVTADKDIFAKFEEIIINEYTVDFVDYNGDLISAQTVIENASAIEPADPLRTGYNFTGWSESYNNVTSNLIIVAEYEKKTYSVSFYEQDGETLIETVSVKYQESAVSPTAPLITGYTFSNWSEDITCVEENMTVTAVYTANPITVHFINADIDDVIISYNSKVNIPNTPSQAGYIFNGWYTTDVCDVAFNFNIELTEDTNIYAKWQKVTDMYTVNIYDYDKNLYGNVQTVGDGYYAIEPAYPTKNGIEFDGWYLDDQYTQIFDFNSPITSNISVYAKGSIIGEISFILKNISIQQNYSVTFMLSDNEVYSTITVAANEKVTIPVTPIKAGSVFEYWENNGTRFSFNTVVNSDLVLTAKWHEIIKIHTVKFVIYSEIVFCEQKVQEGFSVIPPYKAPALDGWEFVGWENNYQNITEDVTINAIYTEKIYKVVFFDYFGNIIETQDVKYGESASEVTPPYIAGYNFDMWIGDYTNIVKNTKIIARYLPEVYNVTFKVGGNVSSTQTVLYRRYAIPYTPSKEGYSFEGWYLNDTPFNFSTPIFFDIELQAKFNIIQKTKYTVNFYNYNGIIYNIQYIEEGNKAVTPPNPYRKGYEFKGWADKFDNVNSDLYIRPIFEINLYSIKFVDYNGDVLKEEIVKYGNTATPPIPTEREGYLFIGWDRSFRNIYEDTICKANYRRFTYSVVFYDYFGNQIGTKQIVQHGDNAIAPSAPSIIGYQFTGWSENTDIITNNLEIYANYELIQFTVTFINDNETIDSFIVNYGETITDSIPLLEKEGYTFIGWCIDLEINKLFNTNISIKKDITLYAKWSQNTIYYHVIFYVDNKIYEINTVAENSNVIPPVNPEKIGYNFIGWDKSLDNITADTEITALFEIKVYNVIFKDYDGTILDTQQVEYNSYATAPVVNEREGYTFERWNTSFASVKKDIEVTAIYSKNSYFITYYINNVECAKIACLYGEIIKNYEINVPAGYIFSGWEEIPSLMPANDLNIYGAFTPASFTFTYNSYDINTGTIQTSEINNSQIEYGSLITVEAISAEGYEFDGWYIQGNIVSKEVIYTFEMPNYDVQITAMFKVKQLTKNVFNVNVGEIIDGKVKVTLEIIGDEVCIAGFVGHFYYDTRLTIENITKFNGVTYNGNTEGYVRIVWASGINQETSRRFIEIVFNVANASTIYDLNLSIETPAYIDSDGIVKDAEIIIKNNNIGR